MRIAHLITRMIVGGAQENTLYNCQDLISQFGDEVLLLTGPALGPEGDLLKQGRGGEVPTQILPSLRRSIHPANDWRASSEIKQALKAFRPDVVHTHSAKAGMLGRLAAWSLGVPAIIHTVHGAPFHPYQNFVSRNFFRQCEWYAARHCHALISVADAMTDQLVAAGVAPREKFTTIYSGMEVEPFLNSHLTRDAVRAELGFGPQHVVVAKIARLFHLKGHDDLITAAQTVVAQQPNVRFLLIGDGVLRKSLEVRIQSLGLAQNFHFTGLVPPTQIPQLLGAADLLVHASLREGLARALPQSLIAGKPVVSYDVDGAREVCQTGQTGFLVPPQDIASLAAGLLALVADPELRKRLGTTGRDRFAEQFRHEFMTSRIRSLYQQVLSRSSKP